MNILVFDSNVVYAKKVCAALKKYVKDASVDMAHNTAVLQHRLNTGCYELVIADVNSAMDTKTAAGILKTASKETPIVVWSAFGEGNAHDSGEMQGVGRSTQFLRKEFDEESIQRVLTEAVHPSV